MRARSVHDRHVRSSLPFFAFVFFGCSGSDFGVAETDSGADTTTQDSVTGDAPADLSDSRIDAPADAPVDAPPKCAPGAPYRTTGPFPVGDSPGAIASGDLDGDGHVDLVVADGFGGGKGMVTVLRGAGDGTFPTRFDFDAGDKPIDVDLGDVDRDGHPDVVVTLLGSKDVRLLIGVGDGRLRAATAIATGFSAPTSSALAPLGSDTVLDLATLEASSHTLQIYAGKGDGTFASTPAKTVVVGLDPLAVSAQKLGSTTTAPIDLVVAATGSDAIDVVPGPDHVSVVAIDGVVAPWAIAFGDFDVDGHLDIAAADHGDGTVFLAFANGAGGFSTPKSFPALGSPVALASGDLDGDGHVDLFVGSATDLVLVRGQKSGTLAAPVSFGSPGAGVVSADFDGDGRADLAATDPSGTVHVILACPH